MGILISDHNYQETLLIVTDHTFFIKVKLSKKVTRKNLSKAKRRVKLIWEKGPYLERVT
jgi:ABC-type lipopolysaccharide export system ATPase subunit